MNPLRHHLLESLYLAELAQQETLVTRQITLGQRNLLLLMGLDGKVEVVA